MTNTTGPRLGQLINANIGEDHTDLFRAFLRAFDSLVQGSVKDKDLATPPGSPANGDAYIVATGGTGAWASKDGKVAVYSTELTTAGTNTKVPGWEFHSAVVGMWFYVADEDTYYRYNGSAWTSSVEALTVGGTLNLEGDAKIKTQGVDGWDDYTGEISVRGTGSNNPSFTQFQSGLYAYEFPGSAMKEVWVSFHVRHNYAVGTKIYLHAHYANAAASPGAGDVRWGFEYTVAKGHNQAAFGAPTTVYVTQTCSTTRYQHMIAELSETDAIPSTQLEPDSLILVRIFRDATAPADTLADAVHLLMVDCHVQSNTFATKNKAPNFYT